MLVGNEKPLGKLLGANIIKLLSSKVTVQAIAFITAPIIARLFSPDDFGIRQIFMSIASVIAVITCLRYEFSIPLGKNEKEASASFILSLFFTLIFTLVVLVVVPVLKEKIAQWFKAPRLKIFLWLLPIAVFISGFGNSLGYWAAREGRFGAMAWSDFGSALGGRLITIAWALIIGTSATGLFAGYFAAAAVGILLLLVFLSRKLVSDIKNANPSFEMFWTVAKRHKKFPIFDIWAGLLNSLSNQLPSIILGLYFSTTVIGYYSLGQSLVSFPMALLGSSIAQVFFPTAAEEYNQKGDLSNIVSNIFRRLVQIGVFPMIALGFFGSILFGFLFGQKWIEAGVYTQILSGYLIFQFASSPLSTVFSIFQRQGTLLVWNVGFISSKLLGLLLGAKTGRPRVALVAYSIVSVIAYSFLLGWILRNNDVSLRWGAKMLLKYVSLSCLLLLPVGCLAWAWGNIFIVLASLGLATIIYAYSLYRFDSGIHSTVTNIITERMPFGRWSKKEID
ncbi:hypothetical protein FJZ31_13660 [Candidatus Poribacteria bacterium]|nr:hypothetical protein [Candidatus Poribacteria bacterium]